MAHILAGPVMAVLGDIADHLIATHARLITVSVETTLGRPLVKAHAPTRAGAVTLADHLGAETTSTITAPNAQIGGTWVHDFWKGTMDGVDVEIVYCHRIEQDAA